MKLYFNANNYTKSDGCKLSYKKAAAAEERNTQHNTDH